MAESNRATPPLCPCGFWGSTNTSGLCSKCYKEQLEQSQKPAASDKTLLPATQKSATQQSTPSSNTTSSAPVIHSSSTTADTGGASFSALGTGGPSTVALLKEPVPTIKVSEAESAVPSDSDATAAAASGATAEGVIAEEEGGACAAAARPIQKNKKRCFRCKARLELAFTEIGRCKCEYVFCELHRLPEQHDCEYNHKESGRKAALDKMVSPKKHIGTSLKRLDSDH